jgi:hypothetical protein
MPKRQDIVFYRCTAVKAVRTLSAQGELTEMVAAIKQILVLRGEDRDSHRLAA